MPSKRPEPTSGNLRPAKRVRLYEELQRLLRAYVLDSKMRPGDRFPPERELAEQLAVSRTSLRQALVALQGQGIVEVRHGDGMYLRRIEGPLEPLTELLARRRRLPEVLEARDALECKAAGLAAERRDDDDLHRISDALQQMRDEIDSGELGMTGDAAFHHAVTLAAKNDVLTHLMTILSDAIAETRLASLSEPGRPHRSLASHAAIAAAIEDRNPRAATAAMRRHIKIVSDVALLRTDMPEGW